MSRTLVEFLIFYSPSIVTHTDLFHVEPPQTRRTISVVLDSAISVRLPIELKGSTHPVGRAAILRLRYVSIKRGKERRLLQKTPRSSRLAKTSSEQLALRLASFSPVSPFVETGRQIAARTHYIYKILCWAP